MSMPSRRNNAAGAVGGVTAIIMWILSLYGIVAPPGIESAITAVLSYVTALIVPNARRSQIQTLDITDA